MNKVHNADLSYKKEIILFVPLGILTPALASFASHILMGMISVPDLLSFSFSFLSLLVILFWNYGVPYGVFVDSYTLITRTRIL